MTGDAVVRLQAAAGNSAVSEALSHPAQIKDSAGQNHSPVVSGPVVQRSIWGDIADLAGDAWSGIKKGARAAWGGITDVASDVVDGLKSAGSAVLGWVSSVGAKVWNAIKWFGSKAGHIISVVGTFLFEKLVGAGTLLWNFIINTPERFWRLLVDAWDAISGIFGWVWTGLRGLAGELWSGLVGLWNWLGEGLSGAYDWLKDGLASGAGWFIDFVSSPSLDKLVDGLLGTLGWLGEGVKGFGQWGLKGLLAAARWAINGLKAFGSWLWDGVLNGLEWLGSAVIHLLEFFGVGEALELLWGLIFRLRPLTGAEVSASSSVHPAGLIPYWQVRVDDDSVLLRIGVKLASLFKTKVTPGAVTTMHVIHLPKGGVGLEVMVHELTHVAQYELIGAVYMPQALHAQGSAAGYDYGDLTKAHAAGIHFSDMNREQQAQICEDYYLVTHGGVAVYGATAPQLAPYISEMRALKF